MKCIKNCNFIEREGPNSYTCMAYNKPLICQVIGENEEEYIRCTICEQKEIYNIKRKFEELEKRAMELRDDMGHFAFLLREVYNER